MKYSLPKSKLAPYRLRPAPIAHTITYDHVKDTFPGRLAAAVVQGWTAEDQDINFCCLYEREDIAVALSKLNCAKRDEDVDAMKFISSALAVHEQGREAQMAVRDLMMYDNLVKRLACAHSAHQREKVTEETIEDLLDMPSERYNEWGTLAHLLEGSDRDNSN